MKTNFRPATSALMCGLILLAMGSGQAVAADDDAAKLKDLERAMTAPGDGDSVKRKAKTRAIVFDNAGSPAAASAPAAALDCANLPPDVKANAVDFSIQFQIGSARVSQSSEGTLASIAKILALAPDRCVIVEGHTDSTGQKHGSGEGQGRFGGQLHYGKGGYRTQASGAAGQGLEQSGSGPRPERSQESSCGFQGCRGLTTGMLLQSGFTVNIQSQET